MPPPRTHWPYASRLQKGGALLDEMRRLVRFWHAGAEDQLLQEAISSNLLGKTTRARAADVLRRAYFPRFIHGPIPQAWRLVRPLEDVSAPIEVLRPVYFWITARSEPLLGDFSAGFILANPSLVAAGITTGDVVGWLERKGSPWSPEVNTKVARGLLAALRDFGILEGRQIKRLAHHRLPVVASAYIAFCLRRLGVGSRSVLDHPDWRLFLLDSADVERLLLTAHQEKLLEFHAAGSMVSLSFPADSLDEYAHAVIERSI